MGKHPFIPLRHRAVRLLWSAAVISDVGTWVQLIVVGSLIARDTGSAFQTGLIAVVTFMPQGLAAPVGGLLADRFDRRKVFAAALLGQATMTGVLAVVLALGVREPLVLTVLILMSSMTGSLGAPSYSAMLPDLVPPEELMAILSLGIFSWNSGRVVGPLLASLLALTVGPAWTVAFNATTFVVMAGAVALVRRPFRPHEVVQAGVMERLADGWRATRSTPGCWLGIEMLIIFNVTAVGFMGLVPIYASALFDGSTGLAGTLASAQGIGAIVGGVAATVLSHRWRRSSMLVGNLVALPIALSAYALAPSRPLAIAAIFVLGGCATPLFLSVSTMIQRDAPPASRGRVMSINQAVGGGFYGLGLMFLGLLADLTSLRVAFVIGALLLVLGFVVLTRRTPTWRAAVEGTLTASEPSPSLV